MPDQAPAPAAPAAPAAPPQEAAPPISILPGNPDAPAPVEGALAPTPAAAPTADPPAAKTLAEAAKAAPLFNSDTKEKPAGIDDKFWDSENSRPNVAALHEALEDTRAEIDKNKKIAEDLRKKMGGKEHLPPENLEDYKLPSLSKELAELVPDDDPIIVVARKEAKEHGLNLKQFDGFMGAMTKHVADLKAASLAAEDPVQRAEDVLAAVDKEMGPPGRMMITATDTYLNDLVADGVISPKGKETLENTITTPAILRAFNEMRVARNGGRDIQADPNFTRPGSSLPPDSDPLIQQAIHWATSSNPDEVRKFNEIQPQRLAEGRPEVIPVILR